MISITRLFPAYRALILLISFSILISCKNGDQQNKESEKEASTSVETKNSEISKTSTILFFGNSLTAGYGLDTDEAFPALIQNRLDSLDYDYKVINAGLSGETTAGGLGRIDWILKQPVDIFVLELGANDGLRGVPLKETKANLQKIIDKVWEKNPETKIVLAGMQIPPNIGKEYTADFKEIFPELADENDIELIPFLLQDVAGNPELNQNDGIHPTAEGAKIVAENVWENLKPLL